MHVLTARPDLNDHIKGRLDSKIVLVEYGDYECVHTAKAYRWVNRLLNDFGANIVYIFRNFPLTEIHPHTTLAALAAEAAGRQNRFWEMHELLLKNFRYLSRENIIVMAKRIGINVNAFVLQMEEDSIIEKIETDMISGEESGVTSTPTFFINGMKVEGPLSLEILHHNILNLLNHHPLSA